MFFLLLLLLFLIFEFKMKAAIEKKESGYFPFPILRGKIIIKRYHNHGAFLNFLQNHTLLLHLISIIFTSAIFIYTVLTLFSKGNTFLKLGLTLLLGGAFSNTYDRLQRGYVVDYFSFSTPWPKLNKIVFNISDFAIMIGAMISVIYSNY